MSPESGGQTHIKAIWYSLPRLIAKPISAVFSAYLGELYIHTFEWRPEDFGLVTSTYSLFRSISYFVLGLIFHFIIGEKGQNQGDENDTRNLQTSKIIAVISIAVHAFKVFGKFWNFLFIPLMACWRLLLKSFKASWNMLCIMPKICWNLLCRARTTGRRYITPYEKVERMRAAFSSLIHHLPEPKPPPSRSASFSSLEYIDLYSLIKSNLNTIIKIAVIHGIGLSSYELSNRAIPMYIEKNESNIRILNSTNLGMYSGAYLLTIMIISLIKFYLNHIISDADLFSIVATFFNVLQLILLPLFYSFTCNDTTKNNEDTKKCCCCKCNNPPPLPTTSEWCQLFAMIGLHGSINFWLSTTGPVAQYAAKYIHGGNNSLKTFGFFILLTFETLTAVGYTVYSVIGKSDQSNSDITQECTCSCSSEDRTQCTPCTAGDKCKCCCCCCCRRSGGNCTCAETCPCKSETASPDQCNCCPSPPSKPCKCTCCPSNSTSSSNSSSSTTDKVLTALSIAAQGFIYLLFYRLDYWWNKNSWFNFALFAICGVVYGLFLMNITNVLTAVLKKKCFEKYKWIINGSMLFFMYFATSAPLYVLYKFYDTEKLFDLDYAVIRHILYCTFAGAYKAITLSFQVINIIAAIVYFVMEKSD